MTREPAEIDVWELVISDEKAAYIFAAHGVSAGDVMDAASFRPRYFKDLKGRYALVGPVRRGRYLLAAIMPGDITGEWRLITAHWLARRPALRIYGEEPPHEG